MIPRILLALLIGVFCLISPAVAQSPAVEEVQFVSASTANPTLGTFRMLGYQEAVVTVQVSAGTHAVTVSSRNCSTCTWITESALGGDATNAIPWQFRVPSPFYEVRISVANAGAETINAWYSLYD